jgi:nucleoside-diphosphate kinase
MFMLRSLLLHLLCPFFCVTAVDLPEAPKVATTTEASTEASVIVAPIHLEQMLEQTLSIIKPDAVEKNALGEILQYFEAAGLKVVASKMIRLTPEKAKQFAAEHKDRPFFNDLVTYMTSGPIVVQVLEGEDAIAVNRRIMGVTDPSKAIPGTIRSDFGTDITHNAVHGSDSKTSAEKEIAFFFSPDEIFSQ